MYFRENICPWHRFRTTKAMLHHNSACFYGHADLVAVARNAFLGTFIACTGLMHVALCRSCFFCKHLPLKMSIVRYCLRGEPGERLGMSPQKCSALRA